MRIIPAAISFTLFFLLLPQIAAAQNEIVTVTAESMAGPWRITLPVWGRINVAMHASFGPMRDAFCRIEGRREALRIGCFRSSGGNVAIADGDVSLDGTAMHIAWGSMMLRNFVDATLDSPGKFTGRYGVKLSGIAQLAQGQLTASKIDMSNGAPDAAKKSALLTKQLVDISGGAPFVTASYLPERMVAPLAGELHSLGAIQIVQYLGRTPTSAEGGPATDKKPPPSALGALPYNNDAFDIYAVEFDHGERICGIRQRADGVVDGLHCV